MAQDLQQGHRESNRAIGLRNRIGQGLDLVHGQVLGGTAVLATRNTEEAGACGNGRSVNRHLQLCILNA